MFRKVAVTVERHDGSGARPAGLLNYHDGQKQAELLEAGGGSRRSQEASGREQARQDPRLRIGQAAGWPTVDAATQCRRVSRYRVAVEHSGHSGWHSGTVRWRHDGLRRARVEGRVGELFLGLNAGGQACLT